MKFVLWMVAGSVVSALGITAVLGTQVSTGVRLAVWLGMLGPLVSTVCSGAIVDRVYRKRPESLTRVMSAAFAAKMIFFGAYVALVVKAGWAQPVPFAISFTGYFLGLHITEAVRLRRLFSNT